MTSQTSRTVRSLPDSHPNRPTRPDPSRPITTNRRSIHNLRLLAARLMDGDYAETGGR